MKRETCLLTLGIAACLACAPDGSAAATSSSQTTIYRLNPDSTFQQGCFDPCLCPLTPEMPMRGTYGLTLIDSNPLFDTYEVSQVNLIYSPSPEVDVHITGSGTYTIGGEVAFLQRLELDLNIGDEPTHHFDSSWTSGANEFPAINITVSMNGIFCYDEVLVIQSKPLPKDEIVNYKLLGDSTFQQGCFDPCDCLLELEQPLVGAFGLTPLLDYGTYQEFAVVNVSLKTRGSTPSSTHTLLGSGTLTIIDGFAGQIHQLQLYVSLDGGAIQHFDSGLTNSAVVIPEIDAVVTLNNFVCYDVVLHLHANPTRVPLDSSVAPTDTEQE